MIIILYSIIINKKRQTIDIQKNSINVYRINRINKQKIMPKSCIKKEHKKKLLSFCPTYYKLIHYDDDYYYYNRKLLFYFIFVYIKLK